MSRKVSGDLRHGDHKPAPGDGAFDAAYLNDQRWRSARNRHLLARVTLDVRELLAQPGGHAAVAQCLLAARTPAPAPTEAAKAPPTA